MQKDQVVKMKTKRIKNAAFDTQWAGLARWNPLPVLLALVSCLMLGCLTRYGKTLSNLVQKREAGEISEAEYQEELLKIKETEPWGFEPNVCPEDNKSLGAASPASRKGFVPKNLRLNK